MTKWFYSFVLVLVVNFSSANNTTYIPDCATNDDCPADRVCAKQSCINPCDGVCGPHTLCHVNNHVVMCSCIPGYEGHPFIGCSASTVVPTHPVCSAHDQCPATKACIEGKCQDPCQDLCGHQTSCTVRNHSAVCTCNDGYMGNPLVGCSQTDIYPICSAHDQCPANKTCIESKCEDPCEGLCGPKTSCTVRNHVAVCTCQEGHTGDPLVGCSRLVFEGGWPPPGQKKYYVETVKQANWVDSLAACIRNKSRLATVDNLEEFEKLRQAINQTGKRLGYFYLSGTDYGYEGDYVWVTNGKALSPKGPMWPDHPQNTQPDNYINDEHCIEIWERYEWQGYYLNDKTCDLKGNYICEYYEI